MVGTFREKSFRFLKGPVCTLRFQFGKRNDRRIIGGMQTLICVACYRLGSENVSNDMCRMNPSLDPWSLL
jgi:hypothetical protein